MKRFVFFLAIGLIPKIAFSESLKTVFNPFTNKSDYITVLSSKTIPIGSTNYVQTNPASQQTTAFNTSSGTVSSQLNTSQIHFQSMVAPLTYPDNMPILTMPDTQTMYFGYQSGVLPGFGGTFNTANGSGAMPFPNTANFMVCSGNSCMSQNFLSGQQCNCSGYACLANLTSGSFDNCSGGSCMSNVTTASNSTCTGSICLRDDSGGNNSANGFQAGEFNTDGNNNVYEGFQAGVGTATLTNANIHGSGVVYIGAQSGQGVSSSTVVNNAIGLGQMALVMASNKAQIGGRQGTGNEMTLLVSTLSVANHYNNAGAVVPLMGSCGVSPSISGFDSAGTITVGGGVTTSCVMNFGTAWTNIPSCVMTVNTSAVTGGITALSTTSITFSFSATLGGGVIYYHCIGRDS